MNKKILFTSGSFGLGHVFRDLEIVKELRNQISDVEIEWLACEPAQTVLSEAGETLHPEVYKWGAETDYIDNVSRDSTKKGKIYNANLIKYFIKSRNIWSNNVRVFDNIVRNKKYDLVIGDETYELSTALRDKVINIEPTFVMIYDFVGADVMTKNPLEKLIAYKINKGWAKGNKKVSNKIMTRIFIGELDDVPDKKYGFLLPNRKECVKDVYHFIGYILPFNSEEYNNKKDIRKKLGYGNEPLIICSVGGTSIGLPVLELCCKSFPIIKEKIPDIKMVLILGPRISHEALDIPEGIIVKGYISKQYEHFAACDLAIVQGGSTTTLELTALKKPFIYFPIEEHFEQQLHVSPRLERLKAGIKMLYSNTTPELLAEQVIENIGKEVNYESIRTDGAKNAVKIIKNILQE